MQAIQTKFDAGSESVLIQLSSGGHSSGAVLYREMHKYMYRLLVVSPEELDEFIELLWVIILERFVTLESFFRYYDIKMARRYLISEDWTRLFYEMNLNIAEKLCKAFFRVSENIIK